MIPCLKAIGISMVALLAMGAISATAAQAETPGVFTAGDTATGEHIHGAVHGEQVNGLHEIASELGTFSCTEATFAGDVSGTDTQVTIAPEYGGECDLAGLPMTVTTDGCNYVFNQPTGNGVDYTGSMDIECDEGKAIQMHLYFDEAHSSDFCTLEMPPQENLSSLTYTNDPGSPDHLLVSANLSGIEINGCGTESAVTYTGDTTMSAFDTLGEPLDLVVGDHFG